MGKFGRFLLPPWLAYPGIERYSIGWRWGSGEDYIVKFGAWYQSLSSQQAADYQSLFPEPVTWKGYWEGRDACDCYVRGDFLLPLWRDQGAPAYSVERLRSACENGQTVTCLLFWGHHPSKDGSIGKNCLSQWWKSSFCSEEITYCCMEQYMMAKKAELFGDETVREQIMKSADPKRIKSLGRKVQHFDENIWEEIRYSIVLNGNFHKFFQNRKLRDFLLSTGDCVLVEASPYDAVWGICMSAQDERAHNPMEWQGRNLLGFALMEVRDELRRVCRHENLAGNEK